MKIVRDSRLEALKGVEHLLYGINYEVWLNLYGPAESDLGLAEALRSLISKECEISSVVPSSPQEAISEIMDKVLYKGHIGSGPLELESKEAEITELMNKVFSLIGLEKAELVTEFGFKNGHPAYPVFWDFAYDIHSNDQRWILVGSSSD
ncbi:hypothetical protein CAI21_08850 [Alkalilimnicola ehrlichii]|uniref:Uncharacterized protein n=1 Tax=Alkalilimnicola ehrlichii TaxID=351052 RepID=A0A3E0WU42_9GAMM|nr:hypothetical protein [Alkalilimnicola ehrlichii]RFA29924.1 hypothetical protein CAI21_08850 [Alkalilimnicola ehrlichii]RFA36512.1 hypothetical protein CAL65_11125 [Alkalilimnicola ehrlichii]